MQQRALSRSPLERKSQQKQRCEDCIERSHPQQLRKSEAHAERQPQPAGRSPQLRNGEARVEVKTWVGTHDHQTREEPRRSKLIGSSYSTSVYYPGAAPQSAGFSEPLPVNVPNLSGRTLNLIVAQYVVMEGVSDDDFEWQLQTCIASVLIVRMDTIPTMEETQLRLATQGRKELIVRISSIATCGACMYSKTLFRHSCTRRTAARV